MAATPAVTVTLAPHVLVAGGALALSDVARIEGVVGAAAQAGSSPVGFAPRLGQVLRLSPGMLAASLRRHGFTGDIVWRGADLVQVRTRSATVSGADIARAALAAARDALPAGSEVSLRRDVPDTDMPMCATRIAARDAVFHGGGAHAVVPVDLFCGHDVYRSVQVTVSGVIERAVMVAAGYTPPGARIDATQFRTERRNVAGLPSEAAAPGLLEQGRRTGRALKGGEILTVDKLAPSDAAAPGDRVRLLARAGEASVEAVAFIVHGGALGQRVTVRLGQDAEQVTGTLSAAATVTLH